MSDFTLSEYRQNLFEHPGFKRDRGFKKSPDKLGRTSAGVLGREFLEDIEMRAQEGRPLSVFEMGCGVGKAISELKQQYPNILATGIDLSVRPENIAGLRLAEIDMEDSELMLKELGVESADVIYSVMAYRYLVDKLKFLSTVYNLLKQKGSAYIDISDPEGLVSPGLSELIEKNNLHEQLKISNVEDDFGNLSYILKIQKNLKQSLSWGVDFDSLEKPSSSLSEVGITKYKKHHA